MKKLICLLFFSFPTWTCQIKLPYRVYSINSANLSDFKTITKFKGCSKQQKRDSLRFIKDFKGQLEPRILMTELNDYNIFLSYNVGLFSLEEALKKKLDLSPNQYIQKLRQPKGVNIITLKKGESLSAKCLECSRKGQSTFETLIMDPIAQTAKKFWFQGKILIRASALVPKTNIPVNYKRLRAQMFEQKTVFTSTPEKLFTDLQSIPFYQASQTLDRGKPIFFTQIQPTNLVQSGRSTKVILKQGNLSMSSNARALQSGKIGELIQLKNLNTKRTLLGKVTGINQVEIEL